MRARAIPAAEKAFLKRLLSALDDRKAEEALCLDLRPFSPWMDFIILVTGNSSPHRHALAEAVFEASKESGETRPRSEGSPEDGWQVLKTGFVVVHVQSPEARVFYDLAGLWGDAPRVLLKTS